MSLFSKQTLICCICNNKFKVTVGGGYDGNFDAGTCSQKCWKEKDWRRVLSIMGKEYYKREEK